MHPSTLGLLLAVVPDCSMVLLDPGFACAGDVVWSLLWVLELDLGLVASFVELGLVVESVCARAPKQIVNIKGNTNESTRFIEVPPARRLRTRIRWFRARHGFPVVQPLALEP